MLPKKNTSRYNIQTGIYIYATQLGRKKSFSTP